MTVTLSSSYPLPDGNNQLPSLAYLKQVIENVVISGLTRDNVDGTSSSLVTASASEPASPNNGEMWLDVSESPYVLKSYDGAAWVAQVFVGTDTPSATTVGLLWYDKTLKVFRVYESRNDITGWHSLHGGYDLYQNTGGTAIVAGDVVVRQAAQSLPAIQESTLVAKRRDVIGIAAEDISNATYGLVAKVGSGLTVKCNVDNTTYGIVEGDFLVTDAFTRGTARSVGLKENVSYEALNQRSWGTPHGAFAMAVTAPSFTGNGTMDVALLDDVGDGRVVMMSRKTVLNIDDIDSTNNITYDNAELTGGNWNTLDVKDTPNGGSVLIDTKHEPLAGVFLHVDIGASSAGTLNLSFSEVALGTASVVFNEEIQNSNHKAVHSNFFVATKEDGASVIGNTFGMKGDGTATLDDFDLYVLGYVY